MLSINRKVGMFIELPVQKESSPIIKKGRQPWHLKKSISNVNRDFRATPLLFWGDLVATKIIGLLPFLFFQPGGLTCL